MRWASVAPPFALCSRKSRKACAVVAKPPGTRTPAPASWLIISPSDAFLPPTDSTSVMRRFSKETTYAAPWGEPMFTALDITTSSLMIRNLHAAGSRHLFFVILGRRRHNRYSGLAQYLMQVPIHELT